MNPRINICLFINRFDDIANRHGSPNWIYATIGKCGLNMDEEEDFKFRFDYKNDEARRAFGFLCHAIHTSPEAWQIITEREQ